MKALPMQNCKVTMYYHNLAGSDDKDFNNYRQFTAPFPADGSPLNYWIEYGDHGGQNKEDKSGHTARDSFLLFVDASGKQTKLGLVDNSGSAHYAKNLRFSDNCPMRQANRQECTVTLYYNSLAKGGSNTDQNKKFTAIFPADGSALKYEVVYSDHGGKNEEDKTGHTAKDSRLVFTDFAGVKHSILLINNSGTAHYVSNVRFPDSCPMTPKAV